MEVIYLPYSPWQWLGTAFAALAGLLLVVHYLNPGTRRPVFGNSRMLAQGAFLCSLLAGGLLALAAWNPILFRLNKPTEPHLVVVADVSKSVVSGPDGWEEVKTSMANSLENLVNSLSDGVRLNGVASLVLVGAQANIYREHFAIVDLPSTFQRLTEHDFPSGSESNLAVGLSRAERLISSTGGQGVVLLITDGHQTEGDVIDTAQQLARLGIPVYVLPLEGWSSAVYLAALDLPPQVEVGQETYLRGLLWNRLDSDETINLRIVKNAGYQQPNDPFAEQLIGDLTGQVLDNNAWSRFREPLVFWKAGIQWVEVKLETVSPPILVERRLFTQVIGPPRLLAIGGDNRWVEQFTTSDFLIDVASAEELTPTTRFSDYDAVVLHWVFASQFQPGVLDLLAQAVTQDGVGLFFANGGHVPLLDEDPAVLTSYKNTPIEPLLPVSVDPRPFTEEPPARQVVILIDVSGSMAGEKIDLAKAIASHIVNSLLRPIDRLDVILFTTGANHIVVDQTMTPQGKQSAINQINNIRAGGGTEPSQALSMIATRKLVNCGLIFISDGEFAPVHERPECQTTIFDIGQDYVDPNFPLALADPIPVGSSFNVAGLKIPYFEPEPRNKYFESGVFTPLRATSLNSETAALTIPPDLFFDGSAVSYVKPEADLIAVRPKLIDPVLAYMTTGEGVVGVLTGELSASWLAEPSSKQAAEAWLRQTLAYSDRDRYSLQITDLGNAIKLCISVHSPGNAVPVLNGVSASLDWPSESTVIVMDRDTIDPATFCGIARLPENDGNKKGFLEITESGPDALGRTQRISAVFPGPSSVASSLTQEDYSSGINLPLLQQVSSAGGGKLLPDEDVILFRSPIDTSNSQPVWPWLLVSGLFTYLLAIGLRRVNY